MFFFNDLLIMKVKVIRHFMVYSFVNYNQSLIHSNVLQYYMVVHVSFFEDLLV